MICLLIYNLISVNKDRPAWVADPFRMRNVGKNVTTDTKRIIGRRRSITRCPRSTSRNRNSSPECLRRNSGRVVSLFYVLFCFSLDWKIGNVCQNDDEKILFLLCVRAERSQGSYRTYRTAPPYAEDATMRSKTSKRGGIVIESTRAPHPMCPNTRSCCCLMLLFNLGLLLICLGFVIVLQLNDPPFVW